MNRLLAAALVTLGSAAAAQVPVAVGPPAVAPAVDLATACQSRQGWTDPAPPERIFGNTWYVGTCGITVLLITSERGHVLVDGGPAAAAPLVAANIAKLGFRLEDVRWIVSSHEHDDHVGALAELKRLTGAQVAALHTAAPALTTGKLSLDDPQRGLGADFPPVTIERLLADGDDVRLGPLRLTAHATPAHSPGSASWTWSSCEQIKCYTMTYADSATLVSTDGYRFVAHPERVRTARLGLSTIAALPCEILITPHPGASGLFDRLGRRSPLADPGACRRYAAAAEERFAARLAQEDAAAP